MQCNIAPGDLVPFLYRSGRGAAAAREAPLRSYRRRRFVVAYAVRASQKKSIILREIAGSSNVVPGECLDGVLIDPPTQRHDLRPIRVKIAGGNCCAQISR